MNSVPCRTILVATLLTIALSSGCAVMSPLLSVTAALTSGAQYQHENESQKTYAAPFRQVLGATKNAMADMGITVEKCSYVSGGQRIAGHTPRYPVTVDVVAVTPKLTNVEVSAGNSILDMDKATALAVTEQIQVMLQAHGVAVAARAAAAAEREAQAETTTATVATPVTAQAVATTPPQASAAARTGLLSSPPATHTPPSASVAHAIYSTPTAVSQTRLTRPGEASLPVMRQTTLHAPSATSFHVATLPQHTSPSGSTAPLTRTPVQAPGQAPGQAQAAASSARAVSVAQAGSVSTTQTPPANHESTTTTTTTNISNILQNNSFAVITDTAGEAAPGFRLYP